MLDYDIRKMYEDMEIRLIKSMKRNLQRHLDEEDETGFKYPQWQSMKLKELKRYQRQNKDIIGHDTKGYSSSISKYLKRELREGSYNALKEYRDAMGDKYKANKRLSNSFFKINDKKVNTLINSVNNDLKTANKAVLRMTNDQYRQVIFKSQMYVANGVMTPKQAIDAANQEFLRRGLNVIEYKDGKRVNIASYSQMAVRTAGTRAMLMGEGAFRKKYKQHLIRISSHGTSCELCIPWQGKVLIDDVYGGGSSKDGKYPLLSDAMEQGLFHPNCRHGHSTYLGGKDDISDIKASYANGKDGHESDAQYEEDMNYINRKIQEYRRLEVGSLDEANIITYRNKRKEWEQKKENNIVRTKYVDEDLKGMDEKLLDENKKQLENLTNKFPKMKKYIDENGIVLGGFTSYDNTIAKVNSSTMTGAKGQQISLNKQLYSNYDNFIKMEKDNILSGWSMPCDDKYISVYSLTHEYGHVIQNILVNEYSLTHEEEYQKMKDRVFKASLSRGKQILQDYEKKIAKGFVDEIKDIALTKDAEATFSKYLSSYGKSNYIEAFAEIFANSQCGKPNVLGEAMNEWLEKRMK